MLQIILGLIVLDFMFGVWAAIKEGAFDWKKVGTFYRTNVIPYVGGYFTLFVVYSLVPGLEDTVAGGLTTTAMFGAVLANLVGSIFGNFSRLGLSKTG